MLIQDIDYAFVNNEPTYVQRKLEARPVRHRHKLVEESNSALNSVLALDPIKDLIKAIGRPLNFGNFRDRVLVGRALVNVHGRRRGQ